MRATIAVGLVWLIGCVGYRDTTRIRIRDPASVAATIQPDQPRYADAWIARDPPASLEVWCPSCVTIKRETPLADGQLVLDGTPARLLRLDGDRVHVRYDFFDEYGTYDRYGRCRSRPCLHHVLAVDLETSRSNVEAIRYEHRVREGGSSTSGLVTSIAFAVAGALLVSAGVYLHDQHESGVGISIGSGVGMMIVGGIFTGLELHDRRAVDTVTTIPL